VGSDGTLRLPSVTVCIPTIPPRRELLSRALRSVERQTHRANDVVVMVDHEGVGAAETRNRAWRATITEVVAFLDDDDEFLPEHLELCLTALVEERAGLAYPWFELVGWDEATPERPDPLATKVDGELVHPLGVPFGPEQERHFRRHAFIPITTVVRRSWLEVTGGYPQPGTVEWPLADCEDWGGHLRLLDAGCKFVHVPHRTWRCHLDDTRSTAGKPWTSVYDVA